jgi:hypothetical protein
MPSTFLPNIHGLGYEPDLHDYRDRVFGFVPSAPLPAFVSPIDDDFPIYDQDGSNACVGFAYKAAAQIVLLNRAGKRTAISPHFVWWNARAVLGWTSVNAGCRIRDAIKVGNEYGAASEGTCPWDPSKYALAPSAEAYDQALDHPAFDYEVINDTQAAKVALVGGSPIIFGTALTVSFDRAGRTGFFPVPDGDLIGGHAMVLVGYDDAVPFPEWGTVGGFRVRNSWTERWGDKGYLWLPYKHFDSDAVQDAWVLRGIRG